MNRYLIVGNCREQILHSKIERFNNKSLLDLMHELLDTPQVHISRVALQLRTPYDTVLSHVARPEGFYQLLGLELTEVIYLPAWFAGLNGQEMEEYEEYLKARIRICKERQDPLYRYITPQTLQESENSCTNNKTESTQSQD